MNSTETIPAIERQLALRASPERVWRAVSDPAELSQWFGQRCELDVRAGGEGWMEWDGHGRFAMRVEEAVAPVRLAIRWMNEPGLPLDSAASTLLEWDLEPSAGGGTTLRLRESGFLAPSSRTGNVVGWISELAELLEYLADEPWQAGIRRTYHLRSDIERVWQAFADPTELAAWWGGVGHLEVREGFEGWWDWPSEGGRFAMRFDRVEPPTYLAWSWATKPEITLADAGSVLHTEWAFAAREDGGTDLHLLETGFTEPTDFKMNDSGWDSDVLPNLRRQLGEEALVPPTD